MSTITTQRPWPYTMAQEPTKSTARQHLLVAMARLTASVLRRHRRRRNSRELMAFSDHMLKDIGLSHGGIASAVMIGWARP